jgi:hypothetical protein
MREHFSHGKFSFSHKNENLRGYTQRENENSGIVEKYSAKIPYEKRRACPINTGPLPPGEGASIRIMGMRRHHHCLKGDGRDPIRFREGSSPRAVQESIIK